MNYYRPGDTPELPEEYISLLQRYVILAPYLTSAFTKELHSKTLFHPDLHLDNIFVDPDTKKITNIIDWQSAPVSEVLFQHRVPTMLPPPGGYDKKPIDSCEDSKSADPPNDETCILNHYRKLVRSKNRLRWAAIKHPHASLLTEPVSLVTGAWSGNDVYSFRHALIKIAAYWKDINPNSGPCPIRFTKEELELHNEEMELLEDLSTVLHLLQEQNLISVGGMVRRELYEQALSVNKNVKKMLMDMVEDDEEKALCEKIWPYEAN
jgi:hypothetical protein